MAADQSAAVRVEGLAKLNRALNAAGADAQDQKALMHELGMIVIRAANPPVGRTGKLAASMRAGRGKTKAVVRAGGARVPYAGVIHYGWAAHNIDANPFLLSALQSRTAQLTARIDTGVDEILRKNGLK